MRPLSLLVLTLLVACAADPTGGSPEDTDGSEDLGTEGSEEPDDTEDPSSDGTEEPGSEGSDGTEPAVDPLCHAGMVGGGFYAILQKAGTTDQVAFLWTTDNCTITFSGFTYDLSGAAAPLLRFAYEGEPVQAEIGMAAQDYVAAEFTLTLTPQNGLPPIGTEMGMDLWVEDGGVVLLEGLLWAP